MLRKILTVLLIAVCLLQPLWAEKVTGGESTLDLYAPVLAGGGGFTTSQGGAAASASNPAAAGDAQRIVFDAGFLALTTTSAGGGFGEVVDLGALFPTKYAVFGGSLHFMHSPGFDGYFPIGTNFGGNFNASKEIYPGFSVGAGLNLGIGKNFSGESSLTAAGDLGARYNFGKLGPLQNFTGAFVFRGLGKSYMPGAFTPAFGVSFDALHIEGQNDKPDPLHVGVASDFSFPTFQNVTGKIGASITIAELITLSTAMGFNVKDIQNETRPALLPSLGLTVNLALLSGGKRLAGGHLPSDGDLAVTMGFKPLYRDVIAIGPGVSWSVGVLDNKPPVITVDYPETRWISPNHDGKADVLEFPVSIVDQRYVEEWQFEIFDESGTAVRTYRNKELRVETQGFKNILSRIIAGQSGVEIPPTMRWDGILDSGDIADDGTYSFVISASDDNKNVAVTTRYTVMVDNTPPFVEMDEIAEAAKTFSPDGDGNKDTLIIGQSGSTEDLWEAGIYDTAGTKVKGFTMTNESPAPVTWDGTDDQGHFVMDGVYSYRISATDKALNSESASIENIIVSTIQPTVDLTISDAYFSPNGDGVKDTLTFNTSVPIKEGVTGWSIAVRNNSGAVQRTLSGAAPVPAAVEFNGRGNSGAVLSEGTYDAELAVNYRNGYVSTNISPVFTLDTTAPRATVRIEYNAFSPNNDGKQDELPLTQEGSPEITWVGEVRRGGRTAANEQPVRTVRFTGTPTGQISWDGLTDTGALAPDGEYTYRLSSTDPAGNSGSSNTVNFSLSTADTPILLSTDLRAFSPNNDRNKDTIAIIPQLQVSQGVSGWKLDVLNNASTVVQTFNGQSAVPASVTWNGKDSAGNTVPDGNYTARIEVRYTAGNQPVAQSRPFTVDTAAPKAQVNAPYTLFSPNADGVKDLIPINVTTEGDDAWEAVITDSKGTVIQSWTWTGKAPDSLSWDGTDKAGNKAPDGTYRFALSSTDEAGNSTKIPLDSIQVDARVPRVIFTASQSAVAPKDGPTGEALKFSVILTPKDGIESWSLELKDESGAVRRRFPAPGAETDAPPESISWNGYDDTGILREGKFTPQLSVTYTKGDVVSVSTSPVTIDVTGPVLSFSSLPEYFSPDNDGVDDELIMSLGAKDLSPIANWSLEIREPEPPNLLFYHIEGRGTPTDQTRWDGRSSKGELVQSATDYPFTFKAVDALGNASSLDGVIGVDVLVIRDGDNLKIMVPSIVFRANEADFAGLPQSVVDNNNRVLRRIAEILNKFRDYRVQVEGHANPTSKPVPAGEAQSDLTLSERRARATVDYLIGYGVIRGRLSAVGRGSTKPVIAFEDHDNWWKNRRVEFILIK